MENRFKTVTKHSIKYGGQTLVNYYMQKKKTEQETGKNPSKYYEKMYPEIYNI